MMPGQTAHVEVTPLAPDEPVVVLSLGTDSKGRTANIRVVRSLGPRVDAQSIQAFGKMSFPATPNSTFEAILPEGATAGR